MVHTVKIPAFTILWNLYCLESPYKLLWPYLFTGRALVSRDEEDPQCNHPQAMHCFQFQGIKWHNILFIYSSSSRLCLLLKETCFHTKYSSECLEVLKERNRKWSGGAEGAHGETKKTEEDRRKCIYCHSLWPLRIFDEQQYDPSTLGALSKPQNFLYLLSFSPNIFLGLTHVYALMNREPGGCCCEADVEPQICILTSYGK